MDVITGLSPLSEYDFLYEKGRLTLYWYSMNVNKVYDHTLEFVEFAYGFRLTSTFYCFVMFYSVVKVNRVFRLKAFENFFF